MGRSKYHVHPFQFTGSVHAYYLDRIYLAMIITGSIGELGLDFPFPPEFRQLHFDFLDIDHMFMYQQFLSI